MGSYCYIEHDGHKWQSYLQRDFETYHVGDKLKWKPSFHSPGSHLDGVYHDDIYSNENAGQYRWHWLVVKDLTLVAVLPSTIWDEGHETKRKELEAQYGIESPPRDMWPEVAWEAAEWERAQPKCVDFLRMKMRQHGMMRMIFCEWDVEPELTALAQPLVPELTLLRDWSYGGDMFRQAATYRVKRLLTEAGKWDEGEYRERPLNVRAVWKGDPLTLDLTVVRFADRLPSAPAQAGAEPQKVLD